MELGDHIRDTTTGATGRVVALFADGAWARRWPGCWRCDAVDPAVNGYSEFLGNYEGIVYLIEHSDRTMSLVRERSAVPTTGVHQALPPPSTTAHRLPTARPRRGKVGRRPKCFACSGSGQSHQLGARIAVCGACEGTGQAP